MSRLVARRSLLSTTSRCLPPPARSRNIHFKSFIVPPHLLQGIADSKENSKEIRESALASLAADENIRAQRKEYTAARLRGKPIGFIPTHLLRAVAESDYNDNETRARARRTLAATERLQRSFQKNADADGPSLPVEVEHGATSKTRSKPHRFIYTMHNNSDENALPGTLVRAENDPKAKDHVANEVFEMIGSALDFYKEHFKWHSFDNKNSDIICTLNYHREYANAFWLPRKSQMVFGDGDKFYSNFDRCVDIIGHELTHAITEHSCPLAYDGEPGALNEHVCDVFGSMIKQKVQNETSEKANWLIGENCIKLGSKTDAIRSMKAPGTAYNHPRLGRDPQVGNMSQYKTISEDNSGVHIFSGIPNRAFYLAAVALGGYSWEKAGQIWWKAIHSGEVHSQCTFKQFADVTVSVAEEEFGKDAAHKVRTAWAMVGIYREW